MSHKELKRETVIVPPFFTKAVPLSIETHLHWYFSKTPRSLTFLDECMVLPITVEEIPYAARDMVIVFIDDSLGVPMPHVVCGLEKDENRYLDTRGNWRGRYKPKVIENPFLYFLPNASQTESEEYTLFIDETSTQLNRDGEGKPLFLANKKPTKYFQTVIDQKMHYTRAMETTRTICRRWNDYELMSSSEIKRQRGGQETSILKGFQTINPDRIRDCEDHVLRDLSERRELGLIFSHVQSLNNYDMLVRSRNA